MPSRKLKNIGIAASAITRNMENLDRGGDGPMITIDKWNDKAKERVNLVRAEGTHSINSTKGNTGRGVRYACAAACAGPIIHIILKKGPPPVSF